MADGTQGKLPKTKMVRQRTKVAIRRPMRRFESKVGCSVRRSCRKGYMVLMVVVVVVRVGGRREREGWMLRREHELRE